MAHKDLYSVYTEMTEIIAVSQPIGEVTPTDLPNTDEEPQQEEGLTSSQIIDKIIGVCVRNAGGNADSSRLEDIYQQLNQLFSVDCGVDDCGGSQMYSMGAEDVSEI